LFFVNSDFNESPLRVLFFMLIIIFAIVSVSVFTTESIIKNLEDKMFADKIKSVKIASSDAEHFFHHLTDILVLTSNDDIVKNTDYSKLITKELKGIPPDADLLKRTLAQDILQKHSAFGTVAFVMANGDMYLTEPYPKQENLGQLNWEHRDWYQGTISSKKPYISEVYNATATQTYAVSVNVPVFSDSEEFLGLWRSVIDLSELYRHIDHVDSNFLVFFDHKGTELPISLSISDTSGPRNVSDFQSMELSLAGKSGILKEISDKQEFLVAYAPIEISSHHWGALLIEPIDVSYSDINNIRMELYILVFLISLGVVISGILYYRNSKTRIIIQKELEDKVQKQHEEIIKSARFSAIGELSARIAHDIRNPLSVIKISLETMKIKKNDSESIERSTSLALRAIDRIDHQINDVMGFLKDSPLDLKKISIKNLIDSIVSESVLDKSVNIILPKNDVTISGDDVKLNSLFSNLLTNAIQAVDTNGNIEIKISSGQNEYAKIEIINDGPMISEEHLDKLFDPLFTTKQTGTGLGLASCKKIVEQHAGRITVKNNPTTFTVLLPKNRI